MKFRTFALIFFSVSYMFSCNYDPTCPDADQLQPSDVEFVEYDEVTALRSLYEKYMVGDALLAEAPEALRAYQVLGFITFMNQTTGERIEVTCFKDKADIRNDSSYTKFGSLLSGTVRGYLGYGRFINLYGWNSSIACSDANSHKNRRVAFTLLDGTNAFLLTGATGEFKGDLVMLEKEEPEHPILWRRGQLEETFTPYLNKEVRVYTPGHSPERTFLKKSQRGYSMALADGSKIYIEPAVMEGDVPTLAEVESAIGKPKPPQHGLEEFTNDIIPMCNIGIQSQIGDPELRFIIKAYNSASPNERYSSLRFVVL